jgi:ferritin-like metal-binding protein YciE
MAQKDDLISWLNDAYAMEVSIGEVLENHTNDVKNIPGMHARLREHLEETHRQADRLKRCIESIGGDVSAGKAWFSSLAGKMKGVSTGMADDQVVKNALSDYATEHFEMACYHSLIAAGEELGYVEVVQVCRQNLAEEEAMAEWLEHQIPEITRGYLRRNPAVANA